MDARLVLAMIYAVIAFLVFGMIYFAIRHIQEKNAKTTAANLNSFVNEMRSSITGSPASNPQDLLATTTFAEIRDPDSLPSSTSSKPVSPASPIRDPLEEVTHLMSLHKIPQAIGLLNKQITLSPDQTDLRVKMIEIAELTKDQELFEEHVGLVQDMGTPMQKQLVARVRELFSGTGADDATLPPHSGLSAHEDDLDQLAGELLSFNSSSSLTTQEAEAAPLEFGTTSFTDTQAAEPLAPPSLPGAPVTEELEFVLDDFHHNVPQTATVSDAADSFLQAALDAPAMEVLDFSGSESSRPELSADSSITPLADPLHEAMDFSLDDKITVSNTGSAPGLSPLMEVEDNLLSATPYSTPAQVPAPAALVTEDNSKVEEFNEDAEISLELAQSYINYGERESAIDLLQDVLKTGDHLQRQRAETLLRQIS